MPKSLAHNLRPQDLLTAKTGGDTPIWLVSRKSADRDVAQFTDAQRQWLKATGFEPDQGRLALLPGADGGIVGAVVGISEDAGPADAMLAMGSLPHQLPAGDYRLEGRLADADLAALAWLLGAYTFNRYRTGNGGDAKPRRLALPAGADCAHVLAIAENVWQGRDLINTPACDMGPEELEAAARDIAGRHDAAVTSIVGDSLVAENFPMIHAVGRASTRAPRLVDITWGSKKFPKVTLIGKGICFDTGGLDIKPADGMLLMKKDMAGAATALALGGMIMQMGLPLCLRILLPIAENAIAGNAFRPGDILPSRSGMTVEIGNTDAEGRLVLADAMTLACEDKPDYLVTFATLTGAARVALGPELPPFYVDDDKLASSIWAAAMAVGDPVWRMPFWPPYEKLLKSPIADVNHISGGSFAGSVTAALFLRKFATGAGKFAHFDIYGWVPKARPASPEGGEVQAARAMFQLFADMAT